MSDQIQVASTTDDLSKVREAAGLPGELTEQEKQDQADRREAEEIRVQRLEDGSAATDSKNFNKRYNKLFHQKHAAEEERDKWRAKAEEYERRLSTNGQAREQASEQQPAEPRQQPPESEPQPEQPTEPVIADPVHARHVAAFRERLAQNPEKKQALEQAMQQAYSQQLDFPPIAVIAAAEMPNGEDVMLHVLQNPNIANALNKMNGPAVVQEIQRISAGLQFHPPARTQAPVASKAPAPIRPLSGHSTRQPLSLDEPDISQAEFRRIRDQQEKQWRRGVR